MKSGFTKLVMVMTALLGGLPLVCAEEMQQGVPDALSPTAQPLQTQGDIELKNVVTLGLLVGTVFDDNALSDNRNQKSDFQYNVEPWIRFQQHLKTLDWGFRYRPGFSYSQRFSSNDSFRQEGSGDLDYKFSRRFYVKASGATAISTNPFQQGGTASGLGVLDQPNPTVILPRVREISSNSTVELTYLLGRFTSLSVTGSFSDAHYHNLFGTSNDVLKLIDTRTVHGRATLNHRFGRRESAGVFVDYQDLEFPKAHARTQTENFSLFNEFDITSHMTVTVFGGPDYTKIHDQSVINFLFATVTIPIFHTQWSGSGGINYLWQRPRDAVHLGFLRKISDGGGLVGSVNLTDYNLEYLRHLTKFWKARIAGDYATNTSLGFSSTSKLIGYSGHASLSRMIGENVLLDLQYARAHQSQSGVTAGALVQDHNRVAVTLTYQFNHPIGR